MSRDANAKALSAASNTEGKVESTTREAYVHQGDAAISRHFQQSRSAESLADFLIPSLRPNMRLLDCGCGAGSITIGLAKYIAPGEAIGIDLDTVPLDLARKLADEVQCTNVRFEQASVYELPFPAGSFGAVYSCAVLPHLSDPMTALREMWRVLEPGGMIGITVGANRGTIFWPDDHYLDQTFDIYHQLVREGGGNPLIGQELHLLLAKVGFQQIEPSARPEYIIGDDKVQRRADAVIAAMERDGTTTSTSAEHRNAMLAAWHKWRNTPGAFSLASWLQVLAKKPIQA